MRFAILIALAILAGCTTNEPRKPAEVITAKVVVAAPCIEPDKVPVRPILRTGSGPYPGGVIASQELIRDKEALDMYATAWEVAAAGCLKKPSNTNDSDPIPKGM